MLKSQSIYMHFSIFGKFLKIGGSYACAAGVNLSRRHDGKFFSENFFSIFFESIYKLLYTIL